jgi:hypothetical protein
MVPVKTAAALAAAALALLAGQEVEDWGRRQGPMGKLARI